MEDFCYYRPYFNPEFESLIEHINPPRVCIDNDAFKDCTLIKVDSAKKHGILLEVVQILTDLDLLISKSYICSDGRWIMDVFHVTDQAGNKITDEDLIQYIQKAICTKRNSKELQVCPGREVRPLHVAMERTALELTVMDQPGLLSEVLAVLTELRCRVSAAVAWTHNRRGACIIYVDDKDEMGRLITDKKWLSYLQEQLQTVVEAHHRNGEKQSVKLTTPTTAQTHTERRLHQLMLVDEDYEPCSRCGESSSDGDRVKYETNQPNNDGSSCGCTQVTVDTCNEKGYSVVSVKCRDRPKLLFDTVCALTDMQYMVFHAAISSESSIAVQEYYLRRKDGGTLDSESERRKVRRCLTAAVERRSTLGLKLDIIAKDRIGLLSDVTRIFRECGLSITRAEIGTYEDKATGTFYVTDVSGRKISEEIVATIEKEIDGKVVVHDKAPNKGFSSGTRGLDDTPRWLSLGSLIWSRIERITGNFGLVRM